MEGPTKPKRGRNDTGPSTSNHVPQVEVADNDPGPDNVMSDPNLSFIVLMRTFEYLDAVELLRASEVCKWWNFVANQDILWKSVKMANCIITDGNLLAKKLIAHGTKELHLDLIIQHDSLAITVEYLVLELKPVTTLKKLTITTASVQCVQFIGKCLRHLRGLNVPFVIGNVFDCLPLSIHLQDLEELTLCTINQLFCFSNTAYIRNLTKLKKLSLGLITHPCNINIICNMQLCNNICYRSMDELLKHLPNSMTSLQLDFGSGSLDISLISNIKNLNKLDLTNVVLKNVELFTTFKMLKYLKLSSKFCIECTNLLNYLPQSLVYLEICTSEIVSVRLDVDIGRLSKFENLGTIKLFGPRVSISVTNASSLLSLKNLRVLSLEGVMNLHCVVGFLPERLLSLTLSDSYSLPETFPAVTLPKLAHLNSLKLYCVQSESLKEEIIAAALRLPKLNNLEVF